jgi:hypothetical protein
MSPLPRAVGASPGLRFFAALVVSAAPLCAAPALAAPPERPASVPIATPRLVAFAPSPGLIEETLRKRLEREARRHGLGPGVPFMAGPGDEVEPSATDGSRRVERAFLRALRGTLDERLEEAARDSAVFAPLFRWIDRRTGGAPESSPDLDVARMESAPSFAASTVSAGAVVSDAQRRGPGDVTLRLRLDAHPRVVLGTRFGALTGRVELPLLEAAPRVSLEHPVGDHGWATFHGGHSADRGAWADLSLQFRF